LGFILNLLMYENDKPAHVASDLKPFWALEMQLRFYQGSGHDAFQNSRRLFSAGRIAESVSLEPILPGIYG
jgi:hypothetical protein